MNLLNRLDLFTTEEGPESEDNTYLGYSLALGHFTGDSHPDIAVGMPRGSNLTGKVIFLTGTTMEQLHNLTGNQVGAYFGHAVAVSDVNGDGLDDVIIGAPLHTDFSLTDGRYETGRIYVVYQNKEVQTRPGRAAGSGREIILGNISAQVPPLGHQGRPTDQGTFRVLHRQSGRHRQGWLRRLCRGSSLRWTSHRGSCLHFPRLQVWSEGEGGPGDPGQ